MLDVAWRVKQILSSQVILHSISLALIANAHLYNQWIPSDVEWIKLNSYGTCFNRGKDIACGGVLSDWSNQWIQGFYAYTGKSGVTSAKL